MGFTFYKSAYKVPTWIIYVHLVNLCISLIFYGITFTLFEIGIAETITYSIGRIFLILGIIHLTFMFNHRLLQLVSKSIEPQKPQSPRTQAQLGKMQLNILEVVINRTVLISISYPQILIMTMIGLLGGNTATYTFVVWYCLVMLLIISSFFLSFRMNKKVYNMACGLCDRGCNVLCRLTATQFMPQRREKSQTQSDCRVSAVEL